jgi:hypothetical protein
MKAMILLLSAICLSLSLAGSLEAGTQDQAVVALHARTPYITKVPAGCSPAAQPTTLPCSQYTTSWTDSVAFVYLTVARADSLAGIAGLSCGIDYDPASLDMTWSQCRDGISFTNSGPNGEWPAAGGGNTITFVDCGRDVIEPDGVHVIAGFFYVYAYGSTVLRITDNENLLSDRELRVADCTPTESVLRAGAGGAIGFGGIPGHNPCGWSIESIADVGNDQGRQVRIIFAAAPVDVPGAPEPILQYEVYRRVDSLPLSEATGRKVPGADPEPLSDQGIAAMGWDYVGAIPAHGESEYSLVAPTLADSTLTQGMHWSAFFIRAATADPFTFYDSPPDSGYSLDNLSPEAPSGLKLSAAALLTWEESKAADFDFFTVYGSDAEFLGSGATVLVTTVGTSRDVSTDPYPFYLVTATDFSGNEGPPRNAVSLAATPAGSSVPVQLGPGAAVTFANVSTAGETQLTPRSEGTAPPVGLRIVPASPPIYYDLTTTATFSGDVEVCITYDPASVEGSEEDLVLFHFDETVVPPSWREITNSLDTAGNVICGLSSSFSLFAVVEPGSPTGLEDPFVVPDSYRLYPSAPNPFRVTTRIQFDLPAPGPATLRVMDLQGRLIRTLLDSPEESAGRHTASWDGRDDHGVRVVPGIYFFHLQAASSATQKVLLLR